MNRFSWTALGMALMLAACNASTPNEASEGGHAAEGEEHGEHEEAPLETEIAAKAAQAAGIQVAPAGPGEIADEHEVQGLLTPIDGRIAQVTARFPGPVRSVRVGVGDQVRTGQVLATVESNLSLTTYTITAPINGVVMARTATVGMSAPEGAPLFEVADHLVIFQYDQDVLHTVVVSQKNFDVTSRSGVIVGVPADRRNGLDDEIGVSRDGVIRGA